MKNEALVLPWGDADQAVLEPVRLARRPPAGQLLKWIGNKQRSAAAIAAYLPDTYDRYMVCWRATPGTRLLPQPVPPGSDQAGMRVGDAVIEASITAGDSPNQKWSSRCFSSPKNSSCHVSLS